MHPLIIIIGDILGRVANIMDFSVEVWNSENDPYFSRFLYEVLIFSDFLRILQFFDFLQHFFFDYKYIWRDRNTSFLKMRGRYDRARCLDNLNHTKVIIHGFVVMQKVVVRPTSTHPQFFL